MPPPSLTLPSWAVDETILDHIEALVLSVRHELGPSNNPADPDEAVLAAIDSMRQYIRNGQQPGQAQ